MEGDDFAILIPLYRLVQINRIIRCENQISGSKDLGNEDEDDGESLPGETVVFESEMGDDC